MRSMESSVGIATRLRAGRPWFDSRQTRDFTILHNFDTGSKAHAAYPTGTGSNFLVVKRPRSEADYSPPPSAEVKSGGAIHQLPHILSWHNS
jgi:hypothetical protein